MKNILNYTFLVLSTVLMVKAYPRDQAHSTTRHKLKSRTLHVNHNEQVSPGTFSAEARQKTHFSRDVHFSDDSSQQHRTDSPGSSQYNQYHSVESRENSPKLPIQNNKEPHFDFRSSPYNSEPMKYSLNNASEKNDRSYRDNYPIRQSQPEYNDNTRRRNYKMTIESSEAENKQYDSSDERDKSKEHQRFTLEDARYGPTGLRYAPAGLMYEPTEGTDKVKQESGYHQFEDKGRKLAPYPRDTAKYPPDSTPDQESYLKTNNKNYQDYSPRPTVNPASSSEQFYSHQRHQYADVSYQHPSKTPLSPPRDSLQYSQYKKEVGLVNPYDRDSNNPQHFHSEDRRVYQHHEPEGHYYGPSSSEPTHSHRQHHGEKDLSKDEESKDRRVYQHQEPEGHYYGPSSSDPAHSHRQHHGEKELSKDEESKDRRIYQHQEPEGHYYGSSSSDTTHSHRQPLGGKKLSSDEESRYEESRDEDYSDANKQNDRNQMKVVSTKKDMQPLPSESDSNLSEEHDGFLDMGAYTDKQGSFGWYADFPVGKEHDKVTYSFS